VFLECESKSFYWYYKVFSHFILNYFSSESRNSLLAGVIRTTRTGQTSGKLTWQPKKFSKKFSKISSPSSLAVANKVSPADQTTLVVGHKKTPRWTTRG
jgi:hypothetical protein